MVSILSDVSVVYLLVIPPGPIMGRQHHVPGYLTLGQLL